MSENSGQALEQSKHQQMKQLYIPAEDAQHQEVAIILRKGVEANARVETCE